jgi:hypothetical protein
MTLILDYLSLEELQSLQQFTRSTEGGYDPLVSWPLTLHAYEVPTVNLMYGSLQPDCSLAEGSDYAHKARKVSILVRPEYGSHEMDEGATAPTLSSLAITAPSQ